MNVVKKKKNEIEKVQRNLRERGYIFNEISENSENSSDIQ